MANDFDWNSLKMVEEGTIPKGVWNRLIDVLHTGWITSFAGGTISRVFGAGTALAAITGGGGGTAANALPFTVTIRTNPDNKDLIQFRVEQNSQLLRGTWILNDRQDIQGLTVLKDDGTVDDSSWSTFRKGNDLIWLEILLGEDGLPSDAKICSWGLGHNWTPSKGPGEDQGDFGKGEGFFQWTSDTDDVGNEVYTQKRARIPIFCSVTKAAAGGGTGTTVNTQMLNSHLRMGSDTYFGNGDDGETFVNLYISMPFPYAAAYQEPDAGGDDGGG